MQATKPVDQEKDFPESFFCPLTHELMRDPVMDHEGNSYERVSVENWLLEHNTSPITRNPLSKDKLAPNRALRDAIDERCQKLGVDPRKNSPAPVPLAPPAPAVVAASGSKANGPLSISVRKAADSNYDVLVSLQSPDGAVRTPVDICCVVDVSGSMQTEATLKTNSGAAESHGLSLLDVVKHAVKTVVSTLHQSDRLSLVSFSDTAKVICDLTSMDDGGKKKVLKAVEDLCTEGSTNIWDGLEKGMNTLQKHQQPGRQSCVMLLTDGQPNVTPPRGELGMLKLYKDKNSGLPCAVSMFGFGYGINSELLRDLATEGGGMYAFIPDASFVGTAFVHATANLLVTRAREVSVSFEPQNGASLVEGPLLGGHSHNFTSWGGVASLGALQYGQSKDLVLRMKIPAGTAGPVVSVTVKYQEDKPYEFTAQASLADLSESPEAEVQRLRLRMVDALTSAATSAQANDLGTAKNTVKTLVAELEKSAGDARIAAYLQDVKGQATEAVSRADWFAKWGRHYMPSLARAHLLQQCNNFKDPGVQVYGGAFFKKQRDLADELFCKLPPPKPSVKKANGQAARPVASMSSYHNRSNPCFRGDCLVSMANGARVAVKDLARGSVVRTPDGSDAAVLCVVKTHCAGTAQLVELAGGLVITPYHPVRVNGRWHFPCDLAPARELACDAVYSFVLSRAHVMVINGTDCVTLGHSFQDDVVRHPYFGSQQIIEDLRSLPGWQRGLVEFAGACMVKNESSGLVCGFVQQLALKCTA